MRLLPAAVVLSTLALTPGPGVAARQAAANGADIFGLNKTHRVSVTVVPSEWSVLQTSTARGGFATGGFDYVQPDGRQVHVGSGFRGYFPWVHASMRLDDEPFADVGLRYKGNFSFQQSSAAAPFRANFKVKLDLFDTKADWDGLETLNFHAGNLDYTLMREALAYWVFRRAGVPASRTAYADLSFTVQGIYQDAAAGRFVLIENVNRQFLRNILPPGTGLLMKPEGMNGGVQSYGNQWESYVSTYRPDRDATPAEQQRVIEFANLISQPDAELFRSKIGTYLDVDEFLRFIAVNAFISNSDSYLGGRHNFYLYLEPKDDKFRFIPWDEDLSLGARSNGMDINNPSSGALVYWLLNDPAVRSRYRTILRELSTTAFDRAELMTAIDAIETMAGTGNAAVVRSFVDGRIAHLRATIAAWPSETGTR